MDGCYSLPITFRESKIAMENPPFEDIFPIEHGEFSIAMLVYWRVGHEMILRKQFHRGTSGKTICQGKVSPPHDSQSHQNFHTGRRTGSCFFGVFFVTLFGRGCFKKPARYKGGTQKPGYNI